MTTTTVRVSVLARVLVAQRRSTVHSLRLGVVAHAIGASSHSGAAHRQTVATLAHAVVGVAATRTQARVAMVETPVASSPGGARSVSVPIVAHAVVAIAARKATRKTLPITVTGHVGLARMITRRRAHATTATAVVGVRKTITRRFSDTLAFSDPTHNLTTIASATTGVRLTERAYYRLQAPTLGPVVDLAVALDSGQITLYVLEDPSLVPVSITPSTIDFYQRDSAPVLRMQVAALNQDGTTSPIDLTGATCHFFIRRQNAVANIFSAAAGTDALALCASLPNPTQLEQAVTASGSGQSVVVDTTAGTGLVNNGPMNVGLPTAANYETIASVGTPDGTHLFGVFAKAHLPGEPVVEVGVASPDPLYNARNGYTTYAIPVGTLASPGSYLGQLQIATAAGLVQHSSMVTINVLLGF